MSQLSRTAAIPFPARQPIALNNLSADIKPDFNAARKSVVDWHRKQRPTTRKPRITEWQKVEEPQDLSPLLESFRPEIDCPAPVKAVYTEFTIASYQFRLYAIAGAVANNDPCQQQTHPSDSNLLLVLQPIANSYVPVGTDLTIQESDRVSAYQNRCWSTHPAYLYTLITGNWEQQFTVEIVLPNVLPFALPPLSFDADSYR